MAAVSSNPPLLVAGSPSAGTSSDAPRRFFVSLKQRRVTPISVSFTSVPPPFNAFVIGKARHRVPTFLPFSAQRETAETENLEETEVLESTDDGAAGENVAEDTGSVDAEQVPASVVKTAVQSYKEALSNDDQSTLAQVEALLQSIESEKDSLAVKVADISSELASERDRVLRISADFDNFRKRTERERLSLVSNVQGEVIESLLPMLDNFERAKAQIKVATEGEEKVNNSYQNIYKQFVEIMGSLGIEVVETVGKPFDPLLHEAIMREDSTEFEEGIIMVEFRKGFKLGDRLLRPSMVKVSAGPGPAKPAEEEASSSSEDESAYEVKESGDADEDA